MEKEKTETKKIDDKKIIFVIISAIVLILLGFLVFKLSPEKNTLTAEEAKIKAENFINENLMMPGTKASITSIEKEYNLYRMLVDIGMGEPIESYISSDGLLFMPQSIDIQEYESLLNESNELTSTEIINKQEIVDIELFVMSHCPYGTQMVKGIVPALEALGNKVNFSLKFNSYIMHEKKELDEQLSQYCIQKENPSKLLEYLKCFNAGGESEPCLTRLNINKDSLEKCVLQADQSYKISEKYNDETTWINGIYPLFPIHEEDNEKYGVQGSPTLIINGENASSERDSQSLLDLICSGFLEQPEECLTELSNIAPGFGFGE